MTDALELSPTGSATLSAALEQIAAGAEQRDSVPEPDFPAEAFDALERAGVMAWGTTAAGRPPAAAELALVRAVSRADGSVGRIFDGHLNAIERIAVQADDALRDEELAAFATGARRAGVWGGDPVGGEGDPAAVIETPAGPRLRGVKTFCSGAGGLHRALVLARPPGGEGPPWSVWIDLTDDEHVQVDPAWYRSHGLRASVSHRVVFSDAPIIERLGEPGAIGAQPWFARDALRTAASWAGMADTAVDGAFEELAGDDPSPFEGLAAGRILGAQRAISLWLDAGAQAMDAGTPEELASISLHARAGIAEACRTLLDEAARACGSRPFARGGKLDRARRDLEVFLLQHRLDPLVARLGRAALTAGTR